MFIASIEYKYDHIKYIETEKRFGCVGVSWNSIDGVREQSQQNLT